MLNEGECYKNDTNCQNLCYQNGKNYLSIFHNRQKRGTSQKEISIEFCFSTKGTRKYYSTGIKVTTNQ